MASDVRDVIDRGTIKDPEEHGRDDDVITKEEGRYRGFDIDDIEGYESNGFDEETGDDDEIKEVEQNNETELLCLKLSGNKQQLLRV